MPQRPRRLAHPTRFSLGGEARTWTPHSFKIIDDGESCGSHLSKPAKGGATSWVEPANTEKAAKVHHPAASPAVIYVSSASGNELQNSLIRQWSAHDWQPQRPPVQSDRDHQLPWRERG